MVRSPPPVAAPPRPASASECASRSTPAASYTGKDYDLVTMFDCLHDMGDPIGAARHVLVFSGSRRDLANSRARSRRPGGGQPGNPVGRAYYAFSTLLCTPSSLAQEVGLALGAQAGEARIRNFVTSAGFGNFRRVAETPFNIVFEARR